MPGPTTTPAVRTLLAAGMVEVTGHVLDFGGAPLAGARVIAGAGGVTANATTDAAGAFVLPGLVAANGDGNILFVSPDNSYMNMVSNMSWPETGTDVTLRPGHVKASVWRGGPRLVVTAISVSGVTFTILNGKFEDGATSATLAEGMVVQDKDGTTGMAYTIGVVKLNWAGSIPTSAEVRLNGRAYTVRVGTTLPKGIPARWSYLLLEMTGTDGALALDGLQYLPSATGTPSINMAPLNLLPGEYTAGVVNFFTYPFSDEGLEFSSKSLRSGYLDDGSMGWLKLDENAAQFTFVSSPYWGSGKAGTTVKVATRGFPATGWTSDFSGFPENGGSSLARHYGVFATSRDASRSISIPAGAPAGYDYFIGLKHVEGPLNLTTAYQVCSLTSKPASVARGGAIRLSGRIPLAGHWGTQLAPAGKTVVIYKRTTAAGQPTSWAPTGWTKVAAVAADRTGAYHSSLLHPKRTTWYVVRYPGSYSAKTGQCYWGAYTSVLKVRVY